MSEKFWQRVFSIFLLFGLVLSTVSPLSIRPAEASNQDKVASEFTPFSPAVIYPEKSDLSPALTSITSEPMQPMQEIVIPLNQLPKADPAKSTRLHDASGMQTVMGTGNMPVPLVNLDGVSNINGVYPPDTQGDIGPNHYVQWVNLSFAIWQIDKVNNIASLVYGPAAGNTLFNGFGGPCQSTNHGDPITLYDPLANRWLMSQFALPNYPAGPFYECIAISQSGDPTGAWYRYQYAWQGGMNDYPKFGIWPDAYYMTANQFSAGSINWAGAGVAAFNRSKMMVGDSSAEMLYFNLNSVNPSFGGILPADLDGITQPPAGAPGLFAEWDDSTWLGDPTDSLRIWEFHVDWATPANSTFGLSGLPNYIIPTMDVDPDMCGYSRNCIPQPGTAVKVDAISDRLMHRLQYRNYGSYQTLVTNHTVDATGTDIAGVHWFELRNTGAGWSLYQDGVYQPDNVNRWMGSAALDHIGNLALGYSVSSGSVYPSVRYAGRLQSDPPGILPQAEVELVAGAGSQTGSAGRWGDYSMMGVDPSDDCTFWYTQEYFSTTGTAPWRTRIGSFKFPNCTLGLTGKLTGTVRDVNTTIGIGGADVQVVLSPTESVTTSTLSDGTYEITLPVGTYDVTASAIGYNPLTVSDVVISSGATTTQDFALTSAPMVTIFGYVTDATTGWPLYAEIDVEGYPVEPVWTDPVSGYYRIDLVNGIDYTFHVGAWVDGYLTKSETFLVNGTTSHNFELDVDIVACTAPGYESGLVNLFSNSFEGAAAGTFPADGWAQLDVSGTSGNWTAPTTGSSPTASPHTGSRLASFNSFSTLPGNSTRLWRSPTGVDLSGIPSATLSFWFFHGDCGWNSSDSIQLQLSTDGGTSWANVGSPVVQQISGGWQQYSFNISSYTGPGMTDVRIGLLGNSAFGCNMHVDDVTMEATCVANSGGLVVGNVYDASTAAPLVGAEVSNDSGETTTTESNPNDMGQAPSFYTLFSPSGYHEFSASKTHYGEDIINVNVGQNLAVWKDFYLRAGRLTFTPPNMNATLVVGNSTTLPLTLANNGGMPVNWEIKELSGGMVPYGPIQEPTFGTKPFKQGYPTASGLNPPAPPVAPPYAAGDVIQNWLTGIFAWGIAHDPMDGTLWLSSPAPGWSGNDTLYEYTTSGTQTGRTYPQTLPHSNGPADMAWNQNTGKMWIMNVNTGVANCIYEINPSTGYTGNSICPGGGTGFPTSQRGLAYDPSTDTYFAGGWNDLMVYRFTPDGTILAQVNTGLAISGLAYNPATQHLFAVVSTTPTLVYVLDVADNYNLIGQFSIPGFSNGGGAGLEIDCDGQLWAVDQSSQMVYEVDSGETSWCIMDVPWLSESPTSGTLPAIATTQLVGFEPQPVAISGQSSAEAEDTIDLPDPPETGEPSEIGLASVPYAPTNVLFDNGSLVTHPGGGAGGSDASALQQSLGLNSFGFNHSVSNSFRVADDFVVSGPGWQIDTITFFAYQVNSGTTSTINHVNLRIWNGLPGAPGSSVIWGNTTTNRLTNTNWSNIYRVSDAGLTNTSRPVMADTVNVGVILPAGHYWLDWQTSGTLASGPWAPPITILGLTTTGDGLQSSNNGSTWSGIAEPNGSQGLPFIIEGSLVPTEQAVDITFDASVPEVSQPGTYTTQLMLVTDTPYIVENIPVTLTVQASPTLGKLSGTVTGMGYCDSNPAPLAHAEVNIQGSSGYNTTVLTDASGHYQWWLDQSYSPLVVTVTHPEHQSIQATGVTIVSSQTTILDFALRRLEPCISVEPNIIEAWVPTGTLVYTTSGLTIGNFGAGDLTWWIWEENSSYSPPGILGNTVPSAPLPAVEKPGSASLAGVTSSEGSPQGGQPDAWFGVTPKPGSGVVRYAHAQCPDDMNSFYIISGVEAGGIIVDSTYKFNAATNNWTTLAPYPDKAEGATGVCYEGKIYVVGGSSHNSLAIYDIASNSWSHGASVPRSAWGAAMGSYEGRIYFMGGDSDFSFGGTSNIVNIYDILSNTWIGTGTPMPTPRSTPGYFQLGKYLYVAGGWGETAPGANANVTERYDMSSDTWEVGPAFSIAKADFGLAATEQYLYAIGGDKNGGGAFDDSSSIWALDWTLWPGGAWFDLADPLAQSVTANNGGFTTYAVSGREIWTSGGFASSSFYNNTVYRPSEPPPDVPWVWEDPIAGSLQHDADQEVGVYLSAISDTVPLSAGTYTATLRIYSTDPVAWSRSVTVRMHVYLPEAPNVSFTSNSPVSIGEMMGFTNTSYPGFPPATLFTWNFGDGTPPLMGNMDPVYHLYSGTGTFTVTLTACNSAGCDSFAADVIVEPRQVYLPMIIK